MRKSLLILFIFSFLTLPLIASAQEFKPYEGATYSIAAPAGWFVVSGDISEKDRMKLPASVREHYNPRSVDAMFMDIKDPAQETQDFKDNINIVIINEAVPINEDLKTELSTVLQQQYEAMFEGFKMLSTGISKIGEYDAYVLEATYSILNYKVKMKQCLVPSKAETLVITCTYEEARDESVSKLCNDAFSSLKFK